MGKPIRSSSSLEVVMVKDANSDGKPNWGDTITFKIETTETTKPNVELTCYQDGHVVYGAVAGFYDGYPWPWTVNMELSSQTWTGGAANAIAELYSLDGRKGRTVLARLSFTVAA